ncbi:hypothetical protein ACJ3XI_01025 [Litorimonas sp. RW-G-Af-16]|uniref:hypothetical protein n=1 Tax=Litorimonas sp. RW-G-Af-16 TaxID=3241168 RepID=UPI00390CD29F
MLKFLLVSVVLLPCFIAPFAFSSDLMKSNASTTFRETYIDQPLEKARNCEDTNIDVYFYDTMITMHSVEYVNEAVSALEECATPTYTIAPILAKSHTQSDVEQLEAQISEMVAVLEAHKIDAEVDDIRVDKTRNNLTINGRTIVLEISDTGDLTN